MAYPHVDPTPLTPISAAATEFSFAASAVDCAENDYIVVWLSNSATTGTISEKTTSAWTLTTLNVTSGHRMALAYLKVGASSPSDVTFQANSGLWQGVYAVYRDADTMTFNAGTITTAEFNASSGSTGALTPSSDNAHVVYFTAWRNLAAVSPGRFLSSDVVGEVTQSNDDATTFQGIAIGTWQQTTAAATAKTFYTPYTQRTGAITLAIKNKTSGKIGKHGIGGVTKATWLGNFGSTHDGLTWAAPDAATIKGIAVSTTHTVTLDHAVAGPAGRGFFTSIAATLSTTGNWVGRKATFAAPINMTGKTLSLEFYALAQLGLQYGAEGAIIKLTDGTQWVAFQLISKMNWVAQKLYTQAIDLENATPYDDSGSAIDWTAITAFELHTHRAGSSTSSRSVGFRNMLLLSTSTMTGGNSAKPLDMTYLDKVLNGWGYVGLCDKQGPSISLKSDVQIGDGSMPTYFDSSATMLSCEGAYSALLQRAVNIPANKIDITIKASASDTIYDRASATSSALQQNYTIDAASSSSATYSFAGKTFVGVLPVDNVGLSWTSATFSGCGEISVAGGGDLTNCIISNTASTDAALSITANGTTLDGCTIDGTGAAYALELGTAVTAITLTDCTITAGSTDKIHVLATTGTVTITISGTTSLVAGDVTSAGAMVDISAPVEYQSVTLSNYVTGSRIQIYDTTNGIELYNDIPAAAPQTLWTDSVAASTSGARDIRVRVAYVSGTTAKSFIEAAIGTVAASGSGIALSYRVNQTDDDTYNSNAVDGSAVTGITIVEGSTDRVQIAIAGGSVSWAQIYAYQCWWLFDSVGITDDGAFIEAPDTANYILTGFKIKNTHASIPLLITGGYGVDSTGSVSALYDTTGTSIFPAPAHVVPYATGSGVTPSDITDIASASATAAATAVWGDSKALTVPKFLGLK